MLSRVDDLSCIPAPGRRAFPPRYLLHQTKVWLLGTGASSPVLTGGAGKFTNKLQGEKKAAAARAAYNHHCRKRHREGPTAKTWPHWSLQAQLLGGGKAQGGQRGTEPKGMGSCVVVLGTGQGTRGYPQGGREGREAHGGV